MKRYCFVLLIIAFSYFFVPGAFADHGPSCNHPVLNSGTWDVDNEQVCTGGSYDFQGDINIIGPDNGGNGNLTFDNFDFTGGDGFGNPSVIDLDKDSYFNIKNTDLIDGTVDIISRGEVIIKDTNQIQSGVEFLIQGDKSVLNITDSILLGTPIRFEHTGALTSLIEKSEIKNAGAVLRIQSGKVLIKDSNFTNNNPNSIEMVTGAELDFERVNVNSNFEISGTEINKIGGTLSISELDYQENGPVERTYPIYVFSGSGTPIDGLTVELYKGNELIQSVVTDSKGFAEITETFSSKSDRYIQILGVNASEVNGVDTPVINLSTDSYVNGFEGVNVTWDGNCDPPSSGDWNIDTENVVCYNENIEIDEDIIISNEKYLKSVGSNISFTPSSEGSEGITVQDGTLNITDNSKLNSSNSNRFTITANSQSSYKFTDSTVEDSILSSSSDFEIDGNNLIENTRMDSTLLLEGDNNHIIDPSFNLASGSDLIRSTGSNNNITITGSSTFSNGNIISRGNLSVESGASLTLDSIDLTTASPNDTNRYKIDSSGSLTIKDSNLNHSSNLFNYDFWSRSGSSLSINDTWINGVGVCTEGSKGIRVDSPSSFEFNRNNVSRGCYGLYLEGTDGNATETIFTNVGTNDLNLSSSTNFGLVDSTFDKSPTYTDSTSNLTVYWSVDTQVVKHPLLGSGPIDGATVKVKDLDGILKLEDETVDGTIDRFEAVEYEEIEGTKNDKTPHEFNGSHPEYKTNVTDMSLTSTRTNENNVTIVLTEANPPLYYDLSTNFNSGDVYDPDKVYSFELNWTDTQAEVKTVLIEHNITGTGDSVNRTMTQISGSDSSGIFQFNYTSIPAGTYYWKSYANDTFDNRNSTEKQVFTIEKGQTDVDLYLNGSMNSDNSVTYPSNSNSTAVINRGHQIDGFKLFRNGSLLGENKQVIEVIEDLPAGYYNFTVSYPETQNYTSFTRTNFLTIEKRSLKSDFYLDESLVVGSEESKAYTLSDTVVNITVNETQFQDKINLFIDSESANSGDEDSRTLSVGEYNYSSTFDDNENFSIDESRFNLTVNRASSSIDMFIDQGTANTNKTKTYANEDSDINSTLDRSHQVSDYNLYWNGTDGTWTEIDSSTSVSDDILEFTRELAAGVYLFKANITQGENYSSFETDVYNLTIEKATPSLDIEFNTSQVVNYPTHTSVDGVVLEGDIDTGTLRRNGAAVDDPDQGLLGVNDYNYEFEYTETQNYTGLISDTETLTVNKGDPTQFMEIWMDDVAENKTVTYPETVKVHANFSGPPGDNLDLGLFRDSQGVTGNQEEADLAAGEYLYEYEASPNEGSNYTSGSVARKLSINKGPTDINLLINDTSTDTSLQYDTLANFTVSLNISEDAELWISNYSGDGSTWKQDEGFQYFENLTVLNTTNGFQNGFTYNITANWTGNENYTKDSESHLLTVTAEPNEPEVYVDFTDSSSHDRLDVIVECSTITENVTIEEWDGTEWDHLSDRDCDPYGVHQNITETHTGLNPNSNHSYRALATNEFGSSDYTVVTSLNPSGNDYKFTRARKQTAPDVERDTDTTLEVTIAKLNNPGSTEFAIYEVNTDRFVDPDDGKLKQNNKEWGSFNTDWNGASGFTVNGLTKGEEYCFTTTGRNEDSVETDESSAACQISLEPPTPPYDFETRVDPNNMHMPAGGLIDVWVFVENTGENIDSYTIERIPGTNVDVVEMQSQINDLEPGHTDSIKAQIQLVDDTEGNVSFKVTSDNDSVEKETGEVSVTGREFGVPGIGFLEIGLLVIFSLGAILLL